eukprot:tig00020961_g16676.t1
MDEREVLACQIQEWLPKLKRVTFPTRIIELPEDFVEYLHEDGLVIPSSARDRRGPTIGEIEEGDTVYDDWSDEGDPEADRPGFPELEARIREAIDELGGSVLPKLNWSCPKDATWIATSGTLECKTVEDVLLLLKGSDFIAHDLDMAFDDCPARTRQRPERFVLALRQWRPLNASMEFRCFVRAGRILGACQRDHSNYYAFLKGMRGEVRARLEELHADYLLPRLAPLDRYAFDAWIDEGGRAWLVDVNPLGPVTDPLLFSWLEPPLAPEGEGEAGGELEGGWELRVVEEQTACVPSLAASSRFPRDFIDLGSSEAIAAFARQARGDPGEE